MSEMNIPKEVLASIRKDPKVRINTASNSHPWFFHIYFPEHIKYAFAPFHTKMFAITEDESVDTAVILAFRGSAKSTIFSMSYPIWAVVGKQQKKHVWIVSQTQTQARLMLANIKTELEDNELLRKDLGPFEEQDDQWGASSLVIPKYDARITAVSMEQSIRGVRHRAYRPDLIIMDDIEDLASVKTDESRQRTFEKLSSEIVPAGDKHTRFIMIGNYLHDESAIARVYNAIENEERPGVTMRVPLLDEDDNIAWPGKFPTMADIEHERARMGDERAFQREHMLVSVGPLDQIIKPDWIQYYDELPHSGLDNRRLFSAMAVDLAIKVHDRADYTAVVSAHVYRIDGKLQIFILPNLINQRMKYPETKELVQHMAKTIWPGTRSRIFVEDVAYQSALIQALQKEGFDATGHHPHGNDKGQRLMVISPLVKDGTVLFPREGAETLIRQLVGFGMEKHDDLADAFAILIHKTQETLDSMEAGTVTIASARGTVFDRSLPSERRSTSRDYWNQRLDDWDEATRL